MLLRRRSRKTLRNLTPCACCDRVLQIPRLENQGARIVLLKCPPCTQKEAFWYIRPQLASNVYIGHLQVCAKLSLSDFRGSFTIESLSLARNPRPLL